MRRLGLAATLTTGAVGAGDHSIHNPLVVGETVYVSWYSDGIRVLDVSDPTNPREIASFVPPAGHNPGEAVTAVRPVPNAPGLGGVPRRRAGPGARQRHEHRPVDPAGHRIATSAGPPADAPPARLQGGPMSGGPGGGRTMSFRRSFLLPGIALVLVLWAGAAGASVPSDALGDDPADGPLVADDGAFGHYAYLAAFSPECAGRPGAQGTGVHIVDIANPASPAKVGFLPAH